MRAITDAYIRFVDTLSEILGITSMYLVILTVAVGFYNVVTRYVGRFIGVRLSSNVFIEIQWYLFSLVFFLGFAYILKHGINVRVDFIYTHWPLRRKAMLDFWGHIVFLIPYCIIGLWVTVSPVIISWRYWEMSPDPGGLPRAPIKSMILVAFGTLLLQAIAEEIKLFRVIRGEEVEVEELGQEQPLRLE